MNNKKEITKARLKEALDRLLEGHPVKATKKGLLTLNKINIEAGLGNSYIHKFPEFVEYAKPLIKKHNEEVSIAVETSALDNNNQLSKEEILRTELRRERELKKRYKQERDDARITELKLQELNSVLMFRLHELQDEINMTKLISVTSK